MYIKYSVLFSLLFYTTGRLLMEEKIKKFAEMVKESRKIVFFGGAGVFGILMLGIVLIAQIISLIATRKTRSALHDLLSDTVTVDLASQLIFDSEEELIKFKEEQHAIMAERSPY